jgi:hypothetical protein
MKKKRTSLERFSLGFEYDKTLYQVKKEIKARVRR